MTEPVAMLFDLDGTLIHSSADLAHAVNVMRAAYGLPEVDLEAVESWIGHGVEPLIHRSLTGDHDGRVDEARLREALAVFRPAYLATGFARTELARGAVRAIEALDSAGHPCAVVTNKPTAPTLAILEKFGLSDRFRAVVCGDTLPVRKPDPAPLIHALELCGTNLGWMVGDSDADAAASDAAGLPFIAIRGGYGRDADPAGFPRTPALLLDSPAELIDEGNRPLEMLRHPPALS